MLSTPPRMAGLVVAVAVLGVVCLLAITVGSRAVRLGAGSEGLGGIGTYYDLYVIWVLRLPRIALALVVGAALGVSGALMQALTRNPLADPGGLGTNAGAAFCVALGIALLGALDICSYMWYAGGGALAATVLVYVIGTSGRGPLSPLRFTLSGVALGAVLGGITTGLALRDPETFDEMRYWQAGSVAGRGPEMLWPVLPFLLGSLMCAALAARPLNAIALGEDLARSVGAHVTRTRVVVIIAVTLPCGARRRSSVRSGSSASWSLTSHGGSSARLSAGSSCSPSSSPRSS